MLMFAGTYVYEQLFSLNLTSLDSNLSSQLNV